MDPSTSALVGAVMPDRRAAADAAAALRRQGIGSDEFRTAVIRRGRRVIDSKADRRVGIGVLTGAIIGAVTLAIAAGSAAAVLATRNTVWLAAAAAGGFIGAVLGAYVGLNRERPQLWQESDWVEVDLEGDEVLLVTRTSKEAEAMALFEGHGGRCVRPNSG